MSLIALFFSACGDKEDRTSLLALPTQDSSSSPASEHAVLVHIPTQDDLDDAHRDALYSLEDDLYSRLQESGAGEFDGNEIGGGEWVLYMYGPDADVLAEAILPAFQKYDLPSGTYLIKRYGEPGALEQRIEL